MKKNIIRASIIIFAIALVIFGIYFLANGVTTQISQLNALENNKLVGSIISGEKNPEGYNYFLCPNNEIRMWWDPYATSDSQQNYWMGNERDLMPKVKDANGNWYQFYCINEGATLHIAGPQSPTILTRNGGAISATPALAYIWSINNSSAWSWTKAVATWSIGNHYTNGNYDNGLVGWVANSSRRANANANEVDTCVDEAKKYADYDKEVRGKGLTPQNKSKDTKLIVDNNNITIGALKISYNGQKPFSGMSGIQAICKDASGKTIKTINVTEGKLKNQATGVWGGKTTLTYFTPDSTTKIDKNTRNYPASNQEFKVVIPKSSVPTNTTKIEINVIFKYMLANGKYIRYITTQNQYTGEAKGLQQVITCDAIRTLYQEELSLGEYALTTSISVAKVWNDAGNKDNVRPSSITVKLMNGTTVVKTCKLSKTNNWKYTFTNLLKFDDSGKEIVYTVKEEPTAKGYQVAITGSTTKGYTITNTALINLKVKKQWSDINNKYGERPTSVVVYLYKDGQKTNQKITLSEKNNWTGEFKDLVRYSGNNDIKYTVKEEQVPDGYKVVIDGSATEGYTIKNILATIGGNVWKDTEVGKTSTVDGKNNTEGDIPLKDVKVTLYDSATNQIAKLNTSTKGLTGSKLMHRVNPTLTDENGNYLFIGVDKTKKYYVVFEYNGQKYLPTEYLKASNKQYASIAAMIKDNKYNTNDWKITSKALETTTARTNFDNKFGEIKAYPNNYTTSNSLGKVGQSNSVFSELKLMGYTLGENGKYSQTEKQLIDGYKYDENGNKTTTYSEGIISAEIRKYIEANKSFPSEKQIKNIYEKIAGTNTEMWRKLQYIEDCKITASTRNKTSVETYRVEDYEDTTGLTYINLGLVARPEVDLALRKDILYAATKINSKTEVYQYDKRANNDEYWLIEYRMRNYADYYGGMYVNGVYKSDYRYRGERTNGGSDLEAYVTYKITVRNSSIDILGQITEIVDYYDKDYTYMPKLSWVMYKDNSADDNTKIAVKKEDYCNMIATGDLSKIPNTRSIKSSNSSKYNTKSDMTTEMNAIYISGLADKKLAVGEQAYIYLTFKVNKDGDNPITVDKDNEFKMNYAEINGYKTYYTDGTVLPNNIKKTSNNVAGLIDINSTPGNLRQSDITGNKYEKNFENDTDRAKALQIKIDDNSQRKISGTVWEDQRTKEVSGTSIGDGVRQTNEIKIQGVTVQLLEKLKDGKEFLWQTTTTDANGAYKFSNFVPGNYIVRFMYGHNLPTVQTKNNVSYNGQDFKSTVYQKEINGKEISGYAEEYYNIRAADTFGKNLSDARDIWEDKTISIGQQINNRPTAVYQNVTLQGRETVNKYLANGAKNHDAEILAVPYASNPNQTYIAELIKNTQVVAETGIIVIEGEYDRQTTLGDSTQKTSNGKENYANGNDVNGTYEIKNLDFGLTERPKAQLELNKQVTNVKVTLANGNVLFDANDAVANLAWIKHKDYDLMSKMKNGKYEDYYNKKVNEKYNRYSYKTDIQDMINNTLYRGGKNGKNGLIQVTMDSELMHGATIQISYKLTVKNVGEIDYTGKDFYYKAVRASEENKVTTTANLIVDYVPNNLQYREGDNEGWSVVKAQDLITTGNVNGSIGTSISKYNTILATDKMNKALKPGETVTKELVLTQTITSQNTQDNMTYGNIAEILQTSNTVGRRMAFSIVGNQDPTKAPTEVDSSKAEEVVILPPFGQMYLYFGLGIAVLAVVVGGVILIKKKILKK